MTDDAQLLRQYVDGRSEAAFAELVRRHLALVYHSAVRQLDGDSHLAQDVAQSVFVLLADKSRSLLAHPSLAAWLHAATHFKVAEVRRAERRRRTREAAAHFMQELMQNEVSSGDWERLRPMIDEVLLELNEADREAVLLRFFEERPFAEIAAHLQLGENSAHKRVERALEKLRERLARRGVKSTVAALAMTLGSQAVLAAPPVGLAASVTGTVMASGLPVAAWSLVSFMSTKTAVTAAAVALVVAGGIATQHVIAERDATATLAAMEQENAALAARVRAEEARHTRQQATAQRPAATTPAPIAPAQTTAVARRLGSGGLASVEESRAFLRANPDVRAALATYHRDTLAAEYADLLATLGLTDAEREQFLALQAAGMRRIVGEHQLTLAETDVSGPEITRQLRELLGEARYQQYREFRSATVQRDVARELTRSLYFTPTPLTPAQTGELKQIVSQAIADPTLGPKYAGGAWPYIPNPVWERVITEASRKLAEPQVDALRELQQQSQFFHAQTEASKAYRAAQAATKEPGK
jgi:RNA polymerase sigma factor (sigma-70 family)